MCGRTYDRSFCSTEDETLLAVDPPRYSIIVPKRRDMHNLNVLLLVAVSG